MTARNTTQPAGNYFDKYGSRNPVVRWMMAGFLDAFGGLVDRAGVSEVLEIGCGEAELSIHMARKGMKVRGCDIAPEAIDEARVRVEAAGVNIELWTQRLEDFIGRSDGAPLVVCCEVLEHLDEPENGLKILSELADPWLLCSVPREPLWRVLNLARARYVSDLGNTPGHVNHWSKRGFIRFVSQRFDVVESRSPLPWTMLLCRRRDA
ncbi:MAG: methyltransferase domain-containing protein [Wenzhouxiangellaceae bacterium]